MELAEIHEVAATRLRGDDQRYTAQRRALVELLAAAGRPLSIPSVMEKSPGLAQSSVYRNLAVLEEAAIVRRIVTADDHASFELAEELGDHHHHLVCTSCGVLEDFVVPAELEAELERALRGAVRSHGFTVDDHVLDLFGTCRACTG